MFPFFPFGFVPPFPFLFPFAAMAGGRAFGLGATDAETGDGEGDGAEARPAGPSFGLAPSALMGMAMMPAMAPFALGSRLARAVEDAGQVAAQVRESLQRDEGPVHVMVGDPNGPLGLAIGLTFIKGTARPALRDATATASAPRLEDMVDVTPARHPA
ncbi:hypothetical protein [Roseospira goensis]|uniref:Uncharacterized protein n=1 Tax=Roseospira goensis TaxID=391922 RepID=A0A7W6S0A2_9PROT|nr:hypothetical protein [Roseospira goensis]MBB4286521.1 hypothetical protein [Roseospira goensis]